MNDSQSGTIEQVIAQRAIGQPFVGYWAKFNWKELFLKSAIISAGIVLLFCIILLKSKATVDFKIGPYLFTYAIFVTIFILSRIISAMLYEASYQSVLSGNVTASRLYAEDYKPTVAFIIPCKNEEREIGDSVIQCYQVDYPKDKIEVIVINDGSTDRTLMVLDELKKFYPSLKIIDWPNQGKRWGMAAGFRVSSSEIIVQLDSDSCVDPKTFRELIAPFQNKKIAAVCAHGIPKNADENIITKMQTAYYFMSFRILKAAESTYNTVFCLSGCCSAYRKSAVMPIIYNWLSESFLGKPTTFGDDRSLTSFILKEGWLTAYSAKAIAYTVVPANWKQLFKQQLRWKKSWIINALLTSRFIFKKQPFVSLFYYFPLVVISFLAPITTFHALIYAPLTSGTLPIFHIAGIFLITALIVSYYRYIDKDNKYWPYLFLWSFLNLFVLSFMIIWAVIRIQDRRWGTR